MTFFHITILAVAAIIRITILGHQEFVLESFATLAVSHLSCIYLSMRLVVYKFFECSTNIPSGLSASNP